MTQEERDKHMMMLHALADHGADCAAPVCSAPIAQAMLRYWDISAQLKDLKAEQQLVGEQWDDLLQDIARLKAEEWIEWLHGGENQTKVRKAWEAKNPRFRMTRRGIEVRPNS